jgi:hypothetical protein
MLHFDTRISPDTWIPGLYRRPIQETLFLVFLGLRGDRGFAVTGLRDAEGDTAIS